MVVLSAKEFFYCSENPHWEVLLKYAVNNDLNKFIIFLKYLANETIEKDEYEILLELLENRSDLKLTVHVEFDEIIPKQIFDNLIETFLLLQDQNFLEAILELCLYSHNDMLYEYGSRLYLISTEIEFSSLTVTDLYQTIFINLHELYKTYRSSFALEIYDHFLKKRRINKQVEVHAPREIGGFYELLKRSKSIHTLIQYCSKNLFTNSFDLNIFSDVFYVGFLGANNNYLHHPHINILLLFGYFQSLYIKQKKKKIISTKRFLQNFFSFSEQDQLICNTLAKKFFTFLSDNKNDTELIGKYRSQINRDLAKFKRKEI